MTWNLGLTPTPVLAEVAEIEKEEVKALIEDEIPHIGTPPCVIRFRIQDATGDTEEERLNWSSRIPQQMKEAQDRFYELLDKGYKLFAIKIGGKRSQVPMLRFDPYAEEIMAVPPETGG